MRTRMPAYVNDPLPRWAQGVCDTLELAPESPLPDGVSWPLPEQWWTLPSPCPDGGSLKGAPYPEGSIISCRAPFVRTAGGRSTRFEYMHGPVTTWMPDGQIRGYSVNQGSSNGFMPIRSNAWAEQGCGRYETAQLSDRTVHVAQWDGNGVLRSERRKRSSKMMGCVRAWDRNGALVHVARFSEEGFVDVVRRPGYRDPSANASGSPEPIDYERVEQQRIQNHLAATEADLRVVDVSGLKPELREERLRNLERLHKYWTQGRFPVNDRVQDSAIPFFIDTEGTACAVGHLMIESGYPELAAMIARDENNDRLAEISTPGVSEWVARSGLTAQEHARIQPTYCRHKCPREDTRVCLEEGQTMPRCYVEACMPNATIVFEGSCSGYVPDPTSDCRPDEVRG